MRVTVYVQILEALSLACIVHAFAPLLPMRVSTPSASSLMAYPSTTFDGPAIAKHYNRRPWEVLSRLVTTTTPLGLWWLSVQCDNMVAPILQRNDAAAQALRNRRGLELEKALCATGSVTFIKYGQALALRPDVVTVPEWAAALATLQDEVGAFDSKLAMQIIADDLNLRDASHLFDWHRNDGQPIASASIGQVYRARVRGAKNTMTSETPKDEVWEQQEAWALEELNRRGMAHLAGQEVALKVQRPDARSSAALDVYLLRLAGATLKKAKNLRSDLVLIVDTFGKQLFEELDYQQEARNAARFRALYGNGQISNVKVPAVYPSLGSSRVLAMEWVDGEKGPWVKKKGGKENDKESSGSIGSSFSSGGSSIVEEKDGRAAAGGDGDDREEALRMLSIGLQCSVRQVLRTGYFHADPHLGNLLRTPEGELCYLDFGMMADVPSKTRYGLVGLILGLQSQDLSLVAETLIDLGFLPDSAPVPSPSSSLPLPTSPSTTSSSLSPSPAPTSHKAVEPQKGDSSWLVGDGGAAIDQREWPSWAWPYDARYDVETTGSSARSMKKVSNANLPKEAVTTAAAAVAVAASSGADSLTHGGVATAAALASSTNNASAATSEALAVVLPALEQAFAAATAVDTDITGSSSSSSSSGVNLNFTRLSAELGALSAGPLPFRTPPFFALIVRTLAIYEGLAKQVDPTFVLLKGAFPWIAAEVLDSADNPDLQALLQKWLVDPKKGGRIRWSQLEKLLNLAAAAATSSSPSSSSSQLSSSVNALKSTREALSARAEANSIVHDGVAKGSTASSRSSSTTSGRRSSSSSSSLSSQGDNSDTNERRKDGGTAVNRELDARLDAVELLLGFLLSPSGAFLLPALVEELADIAEALGRSATRAPLQWLQRQSFPPLGAILPKEVEKEIVVDKVQSDEEALEALGRLFFVGSSGGGGSVNVDDDGGEFELQRLRELASAALSVGWDPSRKVLRSQLATLTREVVALQTERQAPRSLRSGISGLNGLLQGPLQRQRR